MMEPSCELTRPFLATLAESPESDRFTCDRSFSSTALGGRERSTVWASFMIKPNGRLVLVSSTHCCASTSRLSNRWSSCALLAPFGLGDLILGSASRLYAFSVYHNRTSLPSRAIGMTAGTQEVRPSRSSRTKDRPPQISYAHIR